MPEVYKWRPSVYVAGPITHRNPPEDCVCVIGPDRSACPAIRKNVQHAYHHAMALARAGYSPYVPHSSADWPGAFEVDYEFWMEIDFNVIAKCDYLCRIDGLSKGADREVIHANHLGIQVVSIEQLLHHHPGTWDEKQFAGGVPVIPYDPAIATRAEFRWWGWPA